MPDQKKQKRIYLDISNVSEEEREDSLRAALEAIFGPEENAESSDESKPDKPGQKRRTRKTNPPKK